MRMESGNRRMAADKRAEALAELAANLLPPPAGNRDCKGRHTGRTLPVDNPIPADMPDNRALTRN